ncbi:hypothetical protein LOZ22_001932 [Ophidiomyces ophidiicola]|nr:hypothetical protein LOZ22_001932 [Ophidiomyces ophidiicola]
MGSQKRIAKELSELMKTPPAGIEVALRDEADLYRWRVQMAGPDNSPYRSTARAAAGVSLQAADGVVRDQNLPPQRHERRQGHDVLRDATRRRVEAVDQAALGDRVRPEPTGGAHARRRRGGPHRRAVQQRSRAV